MLMSNTTYDIINKINRWLPALGAAYVGLSAIWGWPLSDEVNKTIAVVCALIAATLEISTAKYNKLNGGDL